MTAGVVSFAGTVAGQQVVVVELPDGRRTTHLPVRPAVTVGQPVHTGQVIGTLLPGHCASGCLHWGLLRGDTYLNPMSLVRPAKVQLVASSTTARRPEPPADEPAGPGAPMATGAGRPGGLTRPVDGPVSSPFGMRTHPVTGVHKLHDGVDLAAACGTPIRAAATGRVVFSGHHRAWGHRVVVDHGRAGGTRVRTTYNHLASAGTAVGSVVVRGQVIGAVGSTGLSTGCHLHLGLERDGRLVDPLPWLGRGSSR